MSMSLPQYIIERALNEHKFHDGDFCSQCSISKSKVLSYWRRGLSDLVHCSEQSTKGD